MEEIDNKHVIAKFQCYTNTVGFFFLTQSAATRLGYYCQLLHLSFVDSRLALAISPKLHINI